VYGVLQSVNVIVTVVIFQLLELVTVAIQFPAGQVGPSGQVGQVAPVAPVAPVSHCGQVKVVLAHDNVTVFQSVSQKTISSPLKEAEFILAPVGQVGHCGQVAPVSQVSHCGH
jgi:hypothetical protein